MHIYEERERKKRGKAVRLTRRTPGLLPYTGARDKWAIIYTEGARKLKGKALRQQDSVCETAPFILIGTLLVFVKVGLSTLTGTTRRSPLESQHSFFLTPRFTSEVRK